MQLRPLGRRRPARIGHDQRAAVALLGLEIPHDRRHRLRHVSADEQDRLPHVECLRAETAGRDRSRTPSMRRPQPTTCRSGRCSRRSRYPVRRARTFPADTPSRWSATRRRTRRLRRGRTLLVSLRIADAILSIATSHETGSSVPPAFRASGDNRRSGCRRVAAADHPFRHSPPSLTGNLLLPATSMRSRVAREIHPALQRAVRTVGRHGCGNGAHP